MEHPEVYGPDHPDGLARAKAEMDTADRKRIEAETDAISLASDFLEEARDNLNLSLLDIPSRASLRDMAISDLRRAAATLGYDLVKRDD
jgi:hypothetical protein